jgi:DNA-binding beta-propeller fold protein YncE
MMMAILLGYWVSASSAGEVKATYLYNLSNFFGPLPYNWAIPFVDSESNEVMVFDAREQELSAFNESGMETFRFEQRSDIGSLLHGAAEGNGNILLLASRGNRQVLVRCDFRGRPLSDIDIGKWAGKHLPAGFSGFSPDRVAVAGGRIYLADRGGKKVVVMDDEGNLKTAHDIGKLITSEDVSRESDDLVGFGVDPRGNIYFTIPTLFRAFRLSPDGNIAGFGRPGSIPGAFGIASGIGADGNGNIFVSDTLKCVVMVFDKEFRFLTEFGSRGVNKGELLAPRELAVDGKSRVYVTQAGKKGISVYQVSFNGSGSR